MAPPRRALPPQMRWGRGLRTAMSTSEVDHRTVATLTQNSAAGARCLAARDTYQIQDSACHRPNVATIEKTPYVGSLVMVARSSSTSPIGCVEEDGLGHLPCGLMSLMRAATTTPTTPYTTALTRIRIV